MSGTYKEPKGIEEKSVVKSVLKALALLEQFTPDSMELTVAQLSERTGIQKATCNRLLTTMALAGWLVKSDDGTFTPTIKSFQVGSAAVERMDLRARAKPFLIDLVSRFGDTGYLMVVEGDHVVCIDTVEGDNPLQIRAIAIGSTMPLHAGAASLSLLANREDLIEELKNRELETFTEKTLSDHDDLVEELARIRERGYSVSSEELLPGVAAVGAPVFDSAGRVVAGVSLGGHVSGFDGDRLDEVAAAVREAAQDISRGLGNPILAKV